MKKTIMYMPDELKAALKQAAAREGRSEAVRGLTQPLEPPRPKLPLFSGGDPTLAERFDEELRGFGE
ncbi:MAG: antitoxin [Actinomycetota bacterium]|nr:antitoxin [Actinomycetota bacterium]